METAVSQPTPTTIEAWAEHLGCHPEQVDPGELRARLTSDTVPGLLQAAADRHPASMLAVDEARLTLAELHDVVRRRATALEERGVAPDTRVAVSAPSSLELVTTYLAVLHLGATAVLVNPSSTDHELAATLARADAALLVTDRPGRQPGAVALSDVVAASDTESHPGGPVTPSTVALLAFTSGTTGPPKGVPLTHAHLLSSIRAAMLAWRWQAEDTLVHALPLFHQHGLSGVHATLAAGSSAALLSSFTPEALVATVEREGATVLFGVPSIHRRLLELGAGALWPLRRLRLVTSGSAPLPPALAEEFTAATGLELLERYGLTETGLDLSNRYDGTRVAGRVGTPLPGVEVRLATPTGAPVEDGAEAGEILLRGPQVFDGYLDDPEATAAAFHPGGWFRTGDLGRWDEQGLLEITGRLKELIITGGMNVSPGEVEAVVERLPSVREAAVAGVPHQLWGEEVVAWVVPADGEQVDATAVIEHCREHLAAYKCPKRVLATAELPRNPMGKIVRSELVRRETA
jgi:malonyl-CoA/methylmalonyl-CoA synthetase